MMICARNLCINFTLQFHAILTDSKFLFEADAGELIEHMVGRWVTLLVLHGARTVRQPCDPAHFLVRVAAARTARTARTF